MSVMDQFEIMHEGTVEAGDQASAEATLAFLGPWSLRWDFVKEVMGTARVEGDPPMEQIVRTAAATYPDNPALFANRFRILPRGKSFDGVTSIAYEKCVVQVHYKNPSFDYELPDPAGDALTYATEELDFSADYQSLPESAFHFVSDGMPVDRPLGRMIGVTDYRLVRHKVPYLPDEVIESAVGHVNSIAFRGRPAGTLLFLGARARREITSEGSTAWRIEYRFARRIVSWNAVMRPDTGEFEAPEDSGGRTIYPAFDMEQLP